MQSNNLISIIIPVFNRQELVKETLDSVLAQTYTNWECIVVDDGSTDNTWKVLEEYSKLEPKIKVYKRYREPKGAPTCRNIGIKKSNGELLVFLDSDDLLAPWAIMERAELYIKNPKVDMILSNGVYFNSKDKKFLHYTTVFNCKAIIEHYRKFDVVLQTSAVTWVKEFLLNNKLFWDENLKSWQDTDLFISSFSIHPQFIWGKELPDYYSRQDNDRYAITSKEQFVQKTIENFETFEKWLMNEENESDFRKHFPTFMLFRIEKFMSSTEIRQLIKAIEPKLLNHFNRGVLVYLWLYRMTKNIPVLRWVTYSLRRNLTGAKKQVYGIRKKNMNLDFRIATEEKFLKTKGYKFDEILWKNH